MADTLYNANIEVLGRVITLETKLAGTIEKIDRLVDLVERRHRLLEGDDQTPSLVSRVITLEYTRRAVGWYLASIYTALLGLVVSFLQSKL